MLSSLAKVSSWLVKQLFAMMIVATIFRMSSSFVPEPVSQRVLSMPTTFTCCLHSRSFHPRSWGIRKASLSVRSSSEESLLFNDLEEGSQRSETESTRNLANRPLMPKTREFWLDLRGTAVMPEEAITILETIVFDETPKEVVGADNSHTGGTRLRIDRILVSENLFFRIIQSQKTIPEGTGLFYSTIEGAELVAHLKEKEQSIPAGKIVRYVPGSATMVDPIVALDTVSEGGWLLMEQAPILYDDDTQANLWTREQVAGIVSFLANVSPGLDLSLPTTEGTAGGVLLPSIKKAESSNSDAITRDPRGGGGIAILVRTKAALCELSIALAEADWCTENASITSTTASGILIPTGIKSTDGLSSTRSSSISRSVRTALVLPLDVLLWKGVVDLHLLENDS